VGQLAKRPRNIDDLRQIARMKRKALRAAIQGLESLQRAGVTHVPRPKKSPRVPEPPPPAQAANPKRQNTVFTPPLPAGVQSEVLKRQDADSTAAKDARAAALATVARDVAACTRCAELARTRTQTVFGVGNPNARLVFCGEAPGADEDRLGEPFVGRAGQLLTDIIVKGMLMRREDVYILNILRCRPPGNRNPLPVEAASCREYLDRQLEIIQPEFICCLGAVAAQNLLGTDVPIGQLRGRMHDFHGIKVLCTYHPAYLLRNPQAKRFVWDDIKILLAEMAKTAP
jgi:uracil-DNA glycosylase